MAPKLVVKRGGATRLQVIAARRQIGRLHNARIQVKTITRYHYAACCFIFWIQKFGWPDATTLEILAGQICEYVEWLWDNGFAKSEAGDCLSGIQHFLKVKRRFPTAWSLFRAWTLLEPPCRAPPIPAEVLFGMAGAASATGYYNYALVLLVGFGCFLRTNEAVTLAPCQLHLNAAHSKLVVTLPWTKSAAKRGAVDSVVCDDVDIVRLVAALLRRVAPHAPFIPHAAHFHEFVGQLITAVGVDHLNLRFYSLRRGGATFAFSSGIPMETIIEKGRWNSIATARIYLNHGLQELSLMTQSLSSQRLCKRYAWQLVDLLR